MATLEDCASGTAIGHLTEKKALSMSRYQATLDEYARHSAITDPREFGYLFEDLPSDIPQLMRAIQGLVICLPRVERYGVQVSAKRREEIYLRSLPDMLSRIVELNPGPLLEPRPPDQRLVGLCRDFGTLLVSILRQKGIPARLRVGFAGYFPGLQLKFWDHRIAEYWDATDGRWVLVDPMIDDVSRKTEGIDIDTLDITDNSPFFVAGKVWQDCRTGKSDPNRFGDSPVDIGMPPIRYALMHDFDALNKMELVGTDTWHPLIDKPDSDLDASDLNLLDQIAALTADPLTSFSDFRQVYSKMDYGLAVQHRLSSMQI